MALWQQVPFLIIERVLISNIDGRFAGEHTGTVLRQRIFDGTHFNTFDENQSVSSIVLGIEDTVGTPGPNFHGPKAGVGNQINVLTQRQSTT